MALITPSMQTRRGASCVAAQCVRITGREARVQRGDAERAAARPARPHGHPPRYPGLIASWPGVTPSTACPPPAAPLRPRGHAIRRITITTGRGTLRGGWAL